MTCIRDWGTNLAINPTPVFQAIEQHIKSTTDCAVHLSKIPEDESLTYDEDTGLVEPFIVMYFGGPIRAAGDHNLCDYRHDTTNLYITVDCYSGRYWDSQLLKGHTLEMLTGFKTDDSSPLCPGGGLNFDRASNAVRPTLYVASQSFTCRSNLSSPQR